ncbi:hypothetical protein F9C11_20690 [Amycolatopsis sp. VS8301801F10]|uniref:hypothetical protein n=1 Tax=Amycolatopsis sp. VS8301801F10 TaxID=2652442 RepID=UPI0038FCF593
MISTIKQSSALLSAVDALPQQPIDQAQPVVRRHVPVDLFRTRNDAHPRQRFTHDSGRADHEREAGAAWLLERNDSNHVNQQSWRS